MCASAVSEDPFMTVYFHNKYKTQRMYDDAVDDCLAALRFISDLFPTSKMLENFGRALSAMARYTFLMKILIKSHLLLIK